LRHWCGYKRGRRANSEYRERNSARHSIGQQPPEIAAKLEEAQAAKKVASMAVFTQTLWTLQQESIHQQESIYLRQMGATDNLIQQATAAATVSVEFEVFGQVQGRTKYDFFSNFLFSLTMKICIIEGENMSSKFK